MKTILFWESLSRSPQQRQRLLLLLGFLAPIVGAFFYNWGLRIPFLGSPLRYWTGIPCPFCGLTRSFMAIARGDIFQALHDHWFGPLLFSGFLLATLHYGCEFYYNQPLRTPYSRLLQKRGWWLSVGLLLLVYYGWRLYQLWQSGELLFDILRSPLMQEMLH